MNAAMPANVPAHYRRLAAIVIEGLREAYYGGECREPSSEYRVDRIRRRAGEEARRDE